MLEAERVAAGVSGHTTAKVSAQHGVKYSGLTARHGAGTAATYAGAQTAAATVPAAAAFAAAEPPVSATARKRAEAGVLKGVSKALGNTPAVHRSSYVDPRLVAAYRDGHTITAALTRAARAERDDARAVLEKACVPRVIKRHPGGETGA